MKLHLKGKSIYFLETINSYKDWYSIFINRIFGTHITKIHLNNGLIINGSRKSRIVDLTDEIFVKKVYTSRFINIDQGDTVLDIGANIGVFSLYASKMKAGRIYSVEPLQKNIVILKKNFRNNNLKEPNILELAVSDKNGIEKLYLGDMDSHGSIIKHNLVKSGNYIKVHSQTLEKIINSNKIDKVDFLKIDCEGGEGGIIKSSRNSIWKRIDKIAMEYHDDVSILKHNEIIEKLRINGYKTDLKQTGRGFGFIYAWRADLCKK